MRRFLLRHWIMMVICITGTVITAQGQRIIKSQATNTILPLKEVLASLEKKYQVSILYRENLVRDKMAMPREVTANNPDTALHTLLTPLGLTFKKISTTQIIISEVDADTPAIEETKQTGPPQKLHYLKGTVTNEKHEPVPGVSIIIIGVAKGTTTDVHGNYNLQVEAGTHKVYYSSVGYVSALSMINLEYGNTTNNVTLFNAVTDLSGVVVATGSRASQRTFTNTALPVDNINGVDLINTGQLSLDKALQYRAPGFNTVNMPVHDATSLSDPYEIRNLGPSRTLILINGKRKNPGSLVYIQTSPGRGETETDLSAIPMDAIKRVEILRDGASAQYGSDAIAGVMNIILKDRYDYTNVKMASGITHKGDGFTVSTGVNSGVNVGDKGFVNYSINFQKENRTNRPGTVDAAQDNIDLGDGTAAGLEKVKAFLARFPDARNINGTPSLTAARFLLNAGIPVNDHSVLYGNAAYVYKNIESYANYRTAYWKEDPYNLLHEAGSEYLGFGPTFAGDLNDYNATVGFKTDKGKWNTDASVTAGGNQQLYTVDNTWNPSLDNKSPTHFRPGGYAFNHIVGNVDITNTVNEKLSIGFGTEFRNEVFKIIAGDGGSYTGSGPISFSGIAPENALMASRFNIGGYVDVSYDVTKTLLLNATIRQEYYNDFGGAFVWKVSGRKKLLGDRLTLRSSVSTGFRAPGLHQVNLQVVQQIFTPGRGIQTKGVVSNKSVQAHLLGVPALKPERSLNYTAGVGYKPMSDISITLDYYNIAIRDRIILSSNIAHTADGNTQLDEVLSANDIIGVSFFTNGISTNTQGLDLVASYKNIRIANNIRLTIHGAANYTLANRLSGVVATPKLIAEAGQAIFDYQQEALLLNSRPKYKAIIGGDAVWKKWSVGVSNTVFGPATFRSEGLDASVKLVFKTKAVTDVNLGYQFNHWLSTSLTINNVFCILPGYQLKALDKNGQAILADPVAYKRNINAVTFNGRYGIVTYDGSHFSQLGTTFLLSINCRL